MPKLVGKDGKELQVNDLYKPPDNNSIFQLNSLETLVNNNIIHGSDSIRTPKNGSHLTNVDSFAKTRCTLYNCDTKKTLKLQFNPTQLDRTRSYKFADITSPGMHYPLAQFIAGEAQTFDLECFFYDIPYSGKIPKARSFLEKCVPLYKNKKGNKRPPILKLSYGHFVCKLVITAWKTTEEWRDEKGRICMVYYTLSARRV